MGISSKDQDLKQIDGWKFTLSNRQSRPKNAPEKFASHQIVESVKSEPNSQLAKVKTGKSPHDAPMNEFE